MRVSGLYVLTALGLILSPPRAFAQATADAAGDESAGAIETIEVTGTRIHSPDAVNDHPLTIISAEEIERSHAVSVGDLLRKLPSAGSQGANASQTSATNGQAGNGNDFIDLRNLGVPRTLVLVDGLRLVESGSLDSEGVDLNNIPVAMVDHIEVLRDGASPIYGSDAVAGVVNIILKKNFDGLFLTGDLGGASAGDSLSGHFAGTYGWNFEDGNLTFGIDYLNRAPVHQRDRSWAGDPYQSAVNLPGGGVAATRGLEFPAGGVAQAADPDDDSLPDGGQVLMTGPNRYRAYNPAKNNYDFGREQDLVSGLEKFGVHSSGRYDLNDAVSVFTQVIFSQRETTYQLPPTRLDANYQSDPFEDGFEIPAGSSPARPPFNPFGQDVAFSRSLTEFGDQRAVIDASTFQLVGGLEGTLFDRFHWQAYYSFGQSETTINRLNVANLDNVANTITPGGCAGEPGCVYIDYFGPNGITPKGVNYIRYNDTDHAGYNQRDFAASITGDIVTLPAGPLGFALGAEQRYESGYNTPSALVQSEDSSYDQALPTAGHYDVWELYGELNIPVLADMPFIRRLDLEGAFRYSDYSLFGDATTYKFGVDYQPVEDVRFRVSRSSAFRAPAISELFQGQDVNQITVTDPCDASNGLRKPGSAVDANCTAAGAGPGFVSQGAAATQGGNASLRPETAREWSAGTVVKPHWIPGLTLSADYYRIDLEKAIDQDGLPDYILAQCYGSAGLASPACASVSRDPATGQIAFLYAPRSNIGAIKTDGLDFALDYDAPAADFGLPLPGQLSFDFSATYLLHFDQQDAPGASFQHFAGTFGPNDGLHGSYTHLRARLETVYSQDAWSVGYDARLIGGAKVLAADSSVQAFTQVSDVYYHDIFAQYRLGKATFTFGIDNLLDRKPPLVIDGNTNTNPLTYDVVGRYLYLKGSIAF
jgi:outer membrane receptor protein involved in Fe transport